MNNFPNRGRGRGRGRGQFRGRGRNSFSMHQNPNQLTATSLNLTSFSEIRDALKEMLTEENIAIKLLDPKINFKDFLSNTKEQDIETCIIIMQVILKASKNRIMENNFRELLGSVLNSNFSKERFDKLINIDFISYPDSKLLELIISIMKMSFKYFPGIAYDVFFLRFNNISMLVDNIRMTSDIISYEISQQLDELKILVESSTPNTNTGKRFKRKQLIDDGLEPPDDFRKISIFPTQEDIDIASSDVFLRRNRNCGVYKSVDDYLDVQFRLMREDFIQPLREGLAHLNDGQSALNHSVRIYNNVRLVNYLPVDRLGIVHNLIFDLSRHRLVKWAQSKRFLYGSFVCLKEDDSKPLLFATVANRDIEDLENGLITVKFLNGNPSPNVEYILIETTNMFESYKHVLHKLQETNADNFCLKKYLVFVKDNMSLPAYLERNNQMSYRFSNTDFFPGESNPQWPRAIEIDFDESQFQAFKSALTKEIAIIQGPPGTGKTYLGLKIVKCLLDNVQKSTPGFGPILVVCYTNHALDQFLEGMLAFTDKIIRIGSRSSSELLKNCFLSYRKRDIFLEDSDDRRQNVMTEMNSIKCDLLENQALLKISEDSLISLDRLKCVMSEDHMNCLKRSGIERWLNGGFVEYQISEEMRQLDNFLEWLIHETMMKNIFEIYNEIKEDMRKDNLDNFQEDQDSDVNFINNQRQLDSDDDCLSKLQTEYKQAIERLRRIEFEKDVFDDMNDGFTVVRSRPSKKMYKGRLKMKDKMTKEEVSRVIRLDELSFINRWRLYHYWLSMYLEFLVDKSINLELKYEDLNKQLNELNYDDDRRIMMQQDVIGMTTTGAARYTHVLEEIKCKIIIVEEAAEVLESHIIGSLNSGCEHLILIGDHKQLKPNPTVYELAKTYQLDLSLFERLINNGLCYTTLELQHRMRPEIAEIMKYIYENLKNHESVLEYPNVPGVMTNMFFFNHTELETSDADSFSYSNQFEAEFVVQLCLHLMKNGIKNHKITILTLYSGQLFLLKKMMPKDIFNEVRVCVVDNFQGEENDIIILSLVRSNVEEKIGFLNIENRICVSLSRAKMGLFVFGNFKLLADKNKLWKTICHDLKDKQLLGDTLTLLCQNHPEKLLEIKTPDDFKYYPEGGCEQVCNERLECGHACRKCCHFLDKNHYQAECHETCPKFCPEGHPCREKCGQRCSSCSVLVPKLIPRCGHTQIMPCGRSPVPSCCFNDCDLVLGCGHKCLRKCNEECDDCMMKIKTTFANCEHERECFCSDKSLSCTLKCTAVLHCGHPCSGTCGKCNNGRLHVGCEFCYERPLMCGHFWMGLCSQDCPPCNEKCEEGCFHNRCQRKCDEECIPCMEECKWKCKHKKCTKKCYEECNRDVCNFKCKRKLRCVSCDNGFLCYGVCGEFCPIFCLNCNPQVIEIFFGTERNRDAKFITLWTCGHSLECESMDKYMKAIPENGEIVPKRCPKCKSVINKRSCYRYQNIVKQISKDIQNTKTIIKEIRQATRIKMEHMYKNVIRKDRARLQIDGYSSYIKNALSFLTNWVSVERKINNFNFYQYHAECDRVNMMVQIENIQNLHPGENQYKKLIDELKHCASFSGEFADRFRDKLQQSDILKSVTSLESIDTYNIKFITGRWFKCRQGHYNILEENVGANSMAKCSKCNT